MANTQARVCGWNTEPTFLCPHCNGTFFSLLRQVTQRGAMLETPTTVRCAKCGLVYQWVEVPGGGYWAQIDP